MLKMGILRGELGGTCHNDKPGLNDGDEGGVGKRMRGGSRLEGETCYNNKSGHVREGYGIQITNKGGDGEEEVCES